MSDGNSISSEIAAALHELHAAEAVETSTVFTPAPLQQALLEASQRPDGYDAVCAKIEEYTRGLSRTQALLAALLTRVKILAEQRARRERFNSSWVNSERERLRKEFATNPSGALNSWLAALRSAVANWAISSARELADEQFAFPPAALAQVAIAKGGVKALDDEQATDAIAFLRLLGNESSPSTDKVETAAILACLGRAILITGGEAARSEAWTLFEKAGELAPQSGDVQAALGDWHRVEDPRLASACYQRAIQMAPELPVGYSGLGLLAEAAKQWEESRDWFARAISIAEREEDLESALRRLLAPVSGALLELAARRLTKRKPGVALHMATRALALDIAGPGKRPERHAYGLQGELLEQLGQDEEAAAAYFEAGRRSSLADEYTEARTWLERSLALRPDFAPTYWQLAESMRRLAFDAPSKMEQEKFQTAGLDYWRRGAAIGPIAVNDSWAFVMRALLPDAQTWEDLWNSIYFTECAILLDPDESHRWIYLGIFYDQLDIELSALAFTKRGYDLNPSDLFVTEQYITSLSNYGDFAKARELLEAFPNAEQGWLGRSIKAFLLYHLGQYEESIELSQKSIQENPKSLWIIEVQAVCYRALGQQSEACQQYQKIWDLRDDPAIEDFDAPKLFGVAAYQLGNIDEAAQRLAARVDATSHGPISRLHLALCRCAQGNFDEAEREMQRGLKEFASARLLEEFLRFELKGRPANPISAGWMETERGRSFLAKTEAALEERRQILLRRPSPLEEILRALDRRAQRFPPGKWPTGARATVARLYTEIGDWRHAISLYEELQASEDCPGIATIFRAALEKARAASESAQARS